MHLRTYLLTLIVVTMKKPPSKKWFKKIYQNKKTLIITSIGLLLTIIGLVSYFTFPIILKRTIQSVLNLKPGGEFHQWWTTPGTPTEVGFSFFHIENPREVEMGTEVLKVKEQGTYMFNQYYERKIVNYSPNSETVIFYEKRTYIFDEEKSTGSLDDPITVLNAPLVAIGTVVPKMIDEMPFGPIMRLASYKIFDSFFSGHDTHIFMNTTVRDLIYGYRVDILESAQKMANKLANFGIYDIISTDMFPNNTFGLLYGRNDTWDGPYEMYTGLGHSRDMFGYYKSWNNITKLKWWKDDKCNAIKGTDGTIWPPMVNRKDKLYFFVPELCRSIYMSYDKDSEFKGISTHLFTASDDVLAGIDKNPENECYCMEKQSKRDRCRLNGVFSLSACNSEIPIIVSFPHFLDSDENITSLIEGLKPNPELHRPVVHLEPTMGAVIHGDTRLQYAMRVESNSRISGFDNLNGELYVPLFWFYKKLGLSDDYAEVIKGRLFKPIHLINIIIPIVIVTGFLIIVTAICYPLLRKKEKFSISLLTPSDNGEAPSMLLSNGHKKSSISISTQSKSSHWELQSLMHFNNGPETIL